MKTAIACLAAAACLALVALADDHEGGDGLVHKLMERTHEGRKSPYGRLRQAVAGAEAPWPALEQVVQAFEPMCRALQESKNDEIKGSADGYIDAVKEIATAVKARDAAGVRKGFESLEQSCGDCHYKGGIGGRLEHEEHEEGDEHEHRHGRGRGRDRHREGDDD